MFDYILRSAEKPKIMCTLNFFVPVLIWFELILLHIIIIIIQTNLCNFKLTQFKIETIKLDYSSNDEFMIHTLFIIMQQLLFTLAQIWNKILYELILQPPRRTQMYTFIAWQSESMKKSTKHETMRHDKYINYLLISHWRYYSFISFSVFFFLKTSTKICCRLQALSPFISYAILSLWLTYRHQVTHTQKKSIFFMYII